MTWKISVAILAVATAISAQNIEKAPVPLVPDSRKWENGEYRKKGKVGKKDFYIAEQGNYIRTAWKPEKAEKPYKQLGVFDKIIPGHWNLKYFDPETYKTLSPTYKKLVDSWKENQWPLATIEYCIAKGNPAPTKASIESAGALWIGDSMPEAPIYRLEPVFYFIKTGKLWRGSSMGYTDEASMLEFLNGQLKPRMEKELPFYKDQNHKWTHKELKKLCDIYCEEFFKKVGKPIAWGMFVSPYHIAEMPQTTCVAEKGGDAFANARLRGMNVQSGGGKFKYTWRGHEPTERFAYPKRGWFSVPGREDWGYPLPHMKYYIFRPYFIGSNYSVVEGMPATWVQDIEEDGQYRFTALGRIAKDLIDFIERHPSLGEPYAPVALIMDSSHNMPGSNSGGETYRGYGLKFDNADHMNYGIRKTLFPEHRHTINSGGYSITAPYGEIFDILKPKLSSKALDPKIFDSYKVLFCMGGVDINKENAETLKKYVKDGGSLVINAADLNENLKPAFFGVKLASEKLTGNEVENLLTGKKFKEKDFLYSKLELDGAEAIYSCKGNPIVTRFKTGKGWAFLVAAEYMIQKEAEEVTTGRWQRKWKNKKLLKFVPDFLEHLTAKLTPFDVLVKKEDKPDISWIINKKGEGWVLILFDYSLKREELIFQPGGTAKVIASYPYKSVPFKIACRAPMKDVVELYEERDVKHETANGNIVVKENIRGGDIRVYEFQPHKIEFPKRERYVNFALNKPVKASSTYKGTSPQAAIDGKLNNDDYWQSGLDAKRHYVFDLPQSLEVDLGKVETIDHVFVLFRTWEHRSLERRQFIYKYIVEASGDGKKWTTVIDESKNESPAHPKGLERWFEPTKARYVKLTVLKNSANGGAQVVEFAVMGKEKKMCQPKRKSIIPKWQVQWPESIKNVPKKKKKYLIGMTPESVKPGWMPAGKTWKELNGWVRLFTDNSRDGAVFTKSLYGESVSEIVYSIPSGAEKFVSAIGLGNKSRVASVEFQVFVDGVKKFDSGLYRFGMPVLPVIVDVKGGKELKLVVTDGGDGIRNDYAWWGDPYFIMK